MRKRARRWVDMGVLGAGVALAGGGAAWAADAGAGAAHPERADAVWTVAAVQADGSARVTEVIDYDFGRNRRTGLVREVPGVEPDDRFEVTTDAPDDVSATATEFGTTEFVVGDRSEPVTGRQRYRLDYDVADFAGESLDWATFGRRLSPVREAEVHLVAPFEIEAPMCFVEKGQAAVFCMVRQVAPGHVTVRLRDVPDAAGISIQAFRGAALPEAPPAPEPPAAPPPGFGATADAAPVDEEGAAPGAPALVAAAGVALAAFPVSRLIRRAGRERVSGPDDTPKDDAEPGAGGALGGMLAGGRHGGRPPPTVGRIGEALAGPPRWLPAAPMRVDHAELDGLATVALAPPAELTPAQGGVVLTEQATFDLLAASLLAAHAEGSIEVVQAGGRATGLARGPEAPADPGFVPFADAVFAGRGEVHLGTYDRAFAGAATADRARLRAWRASSGLWDPRSGRRQVACAVLGVVALAVGVAALVVGARDVGAHGTGALPLVALGGVLGGAGLAALVRQWELPVRTPEGSGLWVRVESFRRFLASADGTHAAEAARRGVLAGYTAWAVALGARRPWRRAVEQAGDAIPPGTPGLDLQAPAASLVPAIEATAVRKRHRR